MSLESKARTVRELLHAAQSLVDPSARLDAELLLGHVLGRDRAWLYAHAFDAIDHSVAQAFDRLWSRRCVGEPLAYLLGRREFWSLNLAVDSSTLIPRPETELLVELAMQRCPLDRSCRVLDLGTGSGAIALALARERPNARIIATDRSPAALDVAQRNAVELKLPHIEFRHGDWWDAVAGMRFDLVLSNPPYLGVGDPHLVEGDLRFEPRSALVAAEDGLADIRRIVARAAEHLEEGAWLLVEHGQSQGAAVRGIFESAGLREVTTSLDLEQRERVTLGRG